MDTLLKGSADLENDRRFVKNLENMEFATGFLILKI